jgi:hypothetical protein
MEDVGLKNRILIVWMLEIGNWDLFGICNLGFGI